MIRRILLYALYLIVLVVLATGVILAISHRNKTDSKATDKNHSISQQAKQKTEKAKQKAAQKKNSADTPPDQSAAPTTNAAADATRSAASSPSTTSATPAATTTNGQLTNTGPGDIALVVLAATVVGSAIAYAFQIRRGSPAI